MVNGSSLMHKYGKNILIAMRPKSRDMCVTCLLFTSYTGWAFDLEKLQLKESETPFIYLQALCALCSLLSFVHCFAKIIKKFYEHLTVGGILMGLQDF